MRLHGDPLVYSPAITLTGAGSMRITSPSALNERHDATRRRRMETGGRAQAARRNQIGPCWPSSRANTARSLGMANASPAISSACVQQRCLHHRGEQASGMPLLPLATTREKIAVSGCLHEAQLQVIARFVALGKHAVCG